MTTTSILTEMVTATQTPSPLLVFFSHDFMAVFTGFLVAAVFLPALLGIAVGLVDFPLRKKRSLNDPYSAKSQATNDASIKEDFANLVK